MRFYGQGIQLPWYKYPFNAGAALLGVGLTSVLFDSLATGDGLMTPAVLPAAVFMYMANTALVTGAVSLQLRMNPLRFWWAGTRESGLADLGVYAFGLLGAVVYIESPWTVLVFVIPVSVIYVAFSRLAQRIREREQAEKALKKANDELELRVATRTAELSSTNEQLEHSRRRIVHAQEQLRKAVAEQLHGPVQNRLLVASHWLHSARQDMPPGTGACAENLDRAAQLLDDINQGDLRSAVRRLHPSLIRLSLQSSLRALADEFRNGFQVDFQVHQNGPGTEELWRTGLPEELRLAIYRVTQEALTNVLKHTNASKVDVKLDHPSEDTVTLRIRDNGCGFDVNSTTPGFGILSMEDYCGAVGGTLKVESTPGEGTAIMISVPIPESTATSRPKIAEDLVKPAATALAANGNGKVSADPWHANGANGREQKQATTLLIVDDQPDFCGLIKDLLKPYEDFSVAAESHDGTSALRLVEELQPDVVLLDVEMPGVHGLETAYEIHSNFPGVRVVLMSAYHQREYIEGSLAAGASDFIHKAEFSVNRLRQACTPELVPSLQYQTA